MIKDAIMLCHFIFLVMFCNFMLDCMLLMPPFCLDSYEAFSFLFLFFYLKKDKSMAESDDYDVLYPNVEEGDPATSAGRPNGNKS